ncbi:MAG: hypothetical protein IKJ99_05175 [Oscillospiraceae bacterium]|nr:hypothetical protein [Oscillospiraceae bacterium]
MQDTGNYYVLNHLKLITGLTDRTLRNYLASGILQGEKIDGLWHFTAEQVEEFVRHPAVRPSIVAKNHGIVYDFLLDNKKQAEEICIILDMPGANRAETADFFCSRICEGDYRNIRFAFDGISSTSRVILRGNTADVLGLVNAFKQKMK